MSKNIGWSRQQLLVAFALYCRMPFGKMHYRNPEIARYAALIGRTPSALAMKLTNIASLDPAITSTGRKGLRGTSASDRKMWLEIQQDWGSFANESQKVFDTLDVEDKTDADISDEEPTVSYAGKNKRSQTKVRIGQQFFRKAVLSAYNFRCCISGLAVPKLLVASHIVPWRADAENRLNPRNGLCLSVLHDKAFDLGFLTVADDMTVIVSKRHLQSEDSFFQTALLEYHGRKIAIPEKFKPHNDFLVYHRDKIFEKV